MQEIKCPKCGEIFQVDESGYASIVKQVRDKEFLKDMEERSAQYAKDKDNAVKLAKSEVASQYSETIAQKDAKIAQLEAKIESVDKDRKSVV